MDKTQPAKGKPITTSVPSFSFRFNAEDEELEELHPEEHHSELPELPEEPSSVGPSPSPVPSSSPFNPSPSRDTSPMHRMVKRSTSMEGDSPGSSNTMRLFNELKGKFTKTVEEKLNEIKSEKKQKTLEEKRKILASKDNSSVSDSEECTAPSSGKIDDHSTVSGTSETSTPEQDSTQPIGISADDKRGIAELPLDSSTPKRGFFKDAENTLKNKIRPKVSELRRRRKSSSNEKPVAMSRLEDYNESADDGLTVDDEVESAVEMQEEQQSVSQPPNNKSSKATKAQNTDDWSFLAHLAYLLSQRSTQILLAWPLLCLVLPVPNFLRDFVLGALVMHIFYALYKWFNEPGPHDVQTPLLIPDFSTMPILKVPAVKEHTPITKYEGWMNELPFEYDAETYHINQTRSVFMRLEGSNLRVSLTRQKVRTRAMWNEPPPRRNFYHQRFFDIRNCTVKLLPDKLARKRMWSKKYPICIQLSYDSKMTMSAPDDETFKDVIDEQVSEDAFDDENSEDDSFFKISSTMLDQNQLILFARTDREKDDWLRRLVAASHGPNSPEGEDSVTPSIESSSVPELRISPPSTPEHRPLSPEAELHLHISRFLQQVPPMPTQAACPAKELNKITGDEKKTGSFKYLFKKTNGSGSLSSSPKLSPVGSPVKCPLSKTSTASETPDEEPEELSMKMPPPPADTAWFNAILGRVLFDVLRDHQWSEWVRDRIQRKLSTVKLPNFMEELTVSELDLGQALPVVHRTSAPHMDERGLWVDLDVSYEGSAKICVETKLNLVKLTKADSIESSSGSNRDAPIVSSLEMLHSKNNLKSPIFDSDLEDSAESSSDEETNEGSAEDSSAPGTSSGMGKMLFRMATKITTSKYFQQASEISYIRKAMEEVSNTRVIVIVELKALVGVLAINIPPPPSDRFWYGFRGNPELRLAAKAKIGERLVTLSQVTEFIENKLCVEFQKVFVLPNMDELIIPVMNSRVPN